MAQVEHQIRTLRASGQEPAVVELGDAAYDAIATAANKDGSTLTIQYFNRPSVDVTDLPIRRLGPGETVHVVGFPGK